MFDSKVLCCVLTFLATFGNAAKILGIVPSPAYSHQVAFQPIWKELSLRGHQVTTVTTDPINDPKLLNLTEIDLHCLYELKPDHVKNIVKSPVFGGMLAILSMYQDIERGFFSHHEVQNLINTETEKYDVVMVEYGLMSPFAFANKFNAPLIVITSINVFSDLGSSVGNPTHPILYPDQFLPFEDDLSLGNRLALVGFNVFFAILKTFLILPNEQNIVDKYFGSHYPKVQEMLEQASLVLTNSDPIFHKIKPLIPTIVQFGRGSHRTTSKPLPTELKTVLDSAKDGFIYFSLGSNVKSKDLPKETRNVIIATFTKLPYTVLWKFENDDMPNKPKNLITSKWFPQQDVFKHPNIKLFITQGGLQSMDEAIYDHVPMIGIPFAADQGFNVNKMVAKGLGLSLDYKTLRKDKFKSTILEVINNPKYRNKIKKLAELALDQPMTGLEKAIWWTEYVIRHNGTKHLRSPVLDVPFYQYYLLDVAAVLLTTLIIFSSLVVFVFKILLKLLKKLSASKKIKKN